MNRKNGLTRSDVLVALGLAGMILVWGCMLPRQFRQSRESARDILCKTNLKGYGTAFIMYADDYDQRFPDADSWLFKKDRYPESRFCRWHNNIVNLNDHPEDASEFWRYISDKDNHLCPTFDRLAVSGLGENHYRHDPAVPMFPLYTYSINGYLGAGRFGVVEKFRDVERNPGQIATFTEENVMWDIQRRSSASEAVGTNQMVSRLPRDMQRSRESKDYPPENYKGAFATYHMAPTEDIELAVIDNAPYAVQEGDEYPNFGLCRGNGNAVFMDQHVEAMPYWVDTFDYSWPLRNRIPRPWTFRR